MKETAATSSRITVPEIMRRMNIGRIAVYQLLDLGLLPAIRIRRRWIISRVAFEKWLETCDGRQAEQVAKLRRVS
jgi:excisionase family DNA binding protein